MSEHIYSITVKREELTEDFKVEQKKIYTDFPLNYGTFVKIESFINNLFRTSEYFILAAIVTIEPYMMYLPTFVKKDYDATINFIKNFDNEIIYDKPESL